MIIFHRLSVPPDSIESHSKIVAGLDIIRVEFQGLFAILSRLGISILCIKDYPNVSVRLGKAGLQPNCLTVTFNRFTEIGLLLKRVASQIIYMGRITKK